MNHEDAQRAIDEARAIAAGIPEEDLRPTAFGVLLEHYLKQATLPESPPHPRDGVGVFAPAAPQKTAVPDAHEVKSGSREQQAMWAVMTLGSRRQEATTTAISRIIKDELGHTPETASNLSTTLKGLTPRFVTRTRSGKGYVYAGTGDSAKLFVKAAKE